MKHLRLFINVQENKRGPQNIQKLMESNNVEIPNIRQNRLFDLMKWLENIKMKKFSGLFLLLTILLLVPEYFIGQTFTKVTGPTLYGLRYGQVEWGDMDNDGDMDILTTGYFASYNALFTIIYRNDGNNQFTMVATLPGLMNGVATWGDMDNDGDLDIFLSGAAGSLSTQQPFTAIYRNNGNYTFSDIGLSLEGSVYTEGKWGDLDNDGDIDLIYSFGYGGITTILENDGAGVFTSHANSIIGHGGGEIDLGDYDNDNDLDILICGTITSGVTSTKIYRNDGDLSFSELPANLINIEGSAKWGDYDNDGDLDIVLSGNPTGTSHTTKIYRNDGNNLFTDINANLINGSILGSIGWADFDNDNDLDIIQTGNKELKTSIYLDQNGSFFEHEHSITNISLSDADVCDYDNDGDNDIIIIGQKTDGSQELVCEIYQNEIDVNPNLCVVTSNTLDINTPGHLDYCIQQAVTAANLGNDFTISFEVPGSGDELLVRITNSLPLIDNQNSTITLIGSPGYSGQGLIDIDPTINSNGLHINSNANVTIDGLEFKNFVGQNNTDIERAISAEKANSLLIQNCTFDNNFYPIGVYSPYLLASNISSFEIINNEFLNTTNSINLFWHTGSTYNLRVEGNSFTESPLYIQNYTNNKDVVVRGNIFNAPQLALNATLITQFVGAQDWTIENNQFSRYLGLVGTENAPLKQNFTTTQSNFWGKENESLELNAGINDDDGFNYLVFENQTLYGYVSSSYTKGGPIVRKCKIFTGSSGYPPIYNGYINGQLVLSPSLNKAQILNNQLSLDYTLGDYSTYQPNFVVDFYLSDTNGDLVEFLGSSIEFDASTVTGTHQTFLDLNMTAPGVTINIGDRIAATVTSLGDDVNWGHGTSGAVYKTVTESCDIDISTTEFCYGSDQPTTITGLLAGGILTFNGVAQAGNTFDFNPANNGSGNPYSPATYDISYTVNACTTTKSITINGFNQYNVTTNSALCSGNAINLDLDGSDAGVRYTVYLDNFPTSIFEMGVDGPLTINIPATQTEAGTYTVVADQEGATPNCPTPMTGEITINPTPQFTNLLSDYCSNESDINVLTLTTDYNGGTFTWSADDGQNWLDHNGVIDPASCVGTSSCAYLISYSRLGCTVQGNYNIDRQPDIADLSWEGNLCSGTQIKFRVANPEEGVYYTLYDNTSGDNMGGNSGTDNPLYITTVLHPTAGHEYLATAQHINLSTCTAGLNNIATIMAAPELSMEPEGIACVETEITLAGEPSGGTLSFLPDGGVWTNLTENLFNTGTCGSTACNYQFRYQGSNSCYSEVKMFQVHTQPTDRTLISNGSNCAGNSVSIGVENSQTGITYSLYKGVNLITTLIGDGQNKYFNTFDIAHEGDIYSVTASVGNDCVVNMSTTINIPVSPTAVLGQITGEDNVCPGGSEYTYSLPATGSGYDLEWAFPSGFDIIGNNNTNQINVLPQAYALAGEISVREVNQGCPGESVSTKLVSINQTANLTAIEGPTILCINSNGQQYTATGTADSYEWSFSGTSGGTIVGSGQQVSINWGSVPGTYILQVRGTNTSCSAGEWVSLTVNLLGSATAAEFTAASSICDQAPIVISVNPGDNLPGNIYTWSANSYLNLSTVNGPSTTITGNHTGGTTALTGQLSLHVTNICGNVAVTTRNIMVNPLPEITSLTVNDYIECNGENGAATAIVANYVAQDYILSWTGSSETNLSPVNLTQNGTFTATLSTTGCSSSRPFQADNRPIIGLFPGAVPCAASGLGANEHSNLYLRVNAPLSDFNYTYEIFKGGVSQTTGSGNTSTGVNNISGLAGEGLYNITVRKESCANIFNDEFNLEQPEYIITTVSGNEINLCDAGERLEVVRNLPVFNTSGFDYSVTGSFKDQTFDANVTENTGHYFIELANIIAEYGAGQYQLNIVDNVWSCNTNYEFAINPFRAWAVATDENCNGPGSAQIHTSGANGPFAYHWYNSGGGIIAADASSEMKLESGTYYAEVELLGTGCRFRTETFTIHSIDKPEILDFVALNGCSTELTFTSGVAPYTIEWIRHITLGWGFFAGIKFDISEFSTVTSDYSVKPTNLPNGNYTIKVTDANGCSDEMETDYFAPRYTHNFDICVSWDIEYVEDPPIEINYTTPAIAYWLLDQIDNELNDLVNNVAKKEAGLFNEKCLHYEAIDDELSLTYPDEYKQYTLYYYDRAGNLIQTMPPKAVVDFSKRDRMSSPNHDFGLGTQYKYNSLGQVIEQTSPDGGTSVFVYDKLGRLRFSQNAQQKVDGKWSYSIFDYLGRPIEAGELIDGSNGTTMEGIAEGELNAMPPSYDEQKTNVTEWVRTTYTTPAVVSYKGSIQRFLNNRVSYTETKEELKTYYSYDPHGNVEWMVQEIPGIGRHTIAYEYDLISGNVTKVILNEGRPLESFYHKYEYDEDNRLLAAYTSANGEIWDEDANYQYYQHGPLKRVELGQDNVQGLDYVYTIQGWLKSINDPLGNENNDPGKDGATGSEFAKDVFSMSLNYYNDDYLNSNFDLSGASTYKAAENNLYNGNISAWTSKLFDAKNPTAHNAMGMEYKYDQLNRIKNSALYDANSSGTVFTNPHGTEKLSEYTYDPNGNIISLERRSGVLGEDARIDVLAYTYFEKELKGKTVEINQLKSVVDNSGYTAEGEDIKGGHNYEYDAIGNLIKETEVETGQITTIKWTVQNKVKEVIPSQGDVLAGTQRPYVRYTYDASGNRVTKFVNPRPYLVDGTFSPDVANIEFAEETYYLRDAQGNVMNVYERTNELTDGKYYAKYILEEQDIYGSDRLGISKPINDVCGKIEFKPENYKSGAIDLSNPLSEDIALTYNWATLGLTTETGTDVNGDPIEIPVSHLDMYTLNSGAYTPESKLQDYYAGQVKQTAVGENQAGGLQFYALGATQGGTDVCMIFDKENNLLTGSDGIYIDAGKEMTTFEQDGNYYLLTQQGQKIYKHAIELNTTSGNFEVVNKNVSINNDTPNLTGDIALLEDRTTGTAYLYATSYNGGTNTLDLLRYQLGQSATAATIVATISPAFGSADLQISQKADKLLVEYYTEALNPVTLTAKGTIKVYDLDENYLPELATSIGLTGETPERGSAVFSASGNMVYYRDENETDSYIRSIDLANNNTIAMLSDVTGNMLTAYNSNTYLTAIDPDQNIYHWQEGQSIDFEVVAHTLTDILPQLSVKTGQSAQPEALQIVTRHVREKYYELKDHLGNVRATISDLRTMQNSIAQASLESYNNYYPFGMLMSGRWSASEGYRYGFQGQEQENDIKGVGNLVDYKYRMHDPRIGRFFSVDPLTAKYPFYSPYAFSGNRVIDKIELEGLETADYDIMNDPVGETRILVTMWQDMNIAFFNTVSLVVTQAKSGPLRYNPVRTIKQKKVNDDGFTSVEMVDVVESPLERFTIGLLDPLGVLPWGGQGTQTLTLAAKSGGKNSLFQSIKNALNKNKTLDDKIGKEIREQLANQKKIVSSHSNIGDFVSKEPGAQSTSYVDKLAKEIREAEDWLGKGAWPHKPLRVVNVDGRKIILDGHHRYEAAKKAGFSGEIPSVSVPIEDSGYTLEQLRQFIK